jgi:hypothetical protein
MGGYVGHLQERTRISITNIFATKLDDCDKPHYEINPSRPLDIHIKVAVLHIASRSFPCGFNVSDAAPQTYDDLKYRLCTTVRMTVYAGTKIAHAKYHDAPETHLDKNTPFPIQSTSLDE